MLICNYNFPETFGGVTPQYISVYRMIDRIYSNTRESLLFLVHFPGHRKTLKIRERNHMPWFKYCEPCEFRRQGLCVGGSLYLFRQSKWVGSVKMPTGKEIEIGSIQRDCPRGNRTDYQNENKQIEDLDVEVDLPPYIIGFAPYYERVYWFLEGDKGLVIPFEAGITNGYGKVDMTFPNMQDFGAIYDRVSKLTHTLGRSILRQNESLKDFMKEISKNGAQAFLRHDPKLNFREVEYFVSNSFTYSNQMEIVKVETHFMSTEQKE